MPTQATFVPPTERPLTEEQHAQKQRLANIMDDLKNAGWTLEQLIVKEPFIDEMSRSFTSDELRALADLPSWPKSR